MIFRISADTPMLHIELTEYGCGGRTLLSGVTMTISPIRCSNHERYIWKHNGCSFEKIPLPYDRPTLVYPAHDVDDEGRIVWYFDDKLFNLPRGRYFGTITIPGCADVVIQLELNCRKLRVKSAAITQTIGDIEC